MSRTLSHVAVFAMLERDGKYLFMRRQNTGFMDGLFGMPSGHVEEGEPLLDALQREVREEAGVDVDTTKARCVHVAYCRGGRLYTYFYFSCPVWQGEVKNAEPDKCSELLWARLEHMPVDTIPNVKSVLEHIQAGEFLSDIYIEQARA